VTSVTAPPESIRHRIGLVLAGGAARGAYEVGVLEHLIEHVSRDLGYDVPLDILCGTSVGAMNVACLAAYADEPVARVERLAAVWAGLNIEEVLRPSGPGVFDTVRSLLGRVPSVEASALFDPTPLEHLLSRSVAFDRIAEHLRSGRIDAVAISATQVTSGRTVVFVQRRGSHDLDWGGTANVSARAVRLLPVHALASAAVPLMFPAVRVDGRYYCDGGIRQNIPLSPARRLGADGVIVVNPKHPSRAEPGIESDREAAFPSPLFLLGKTLNALLLDRIDNEIDRLEKINEIIDAGSERWGTAFCEELNRSMGYPPGRGLRRLTTVHIRSSANIGELAADYVRSSRFHVRGLLGRVMKRLAQGDATREADLLSYLLFDGPFAQTLMDLGRSDARAHHDDLCGLFEKLRKPE
jgi:NTE family protein